MSEYQENKTNKYTSQLLDYISDEEPGDDLIWETLDEFEDFEIENELSRNNNVTTKIVSSSNDPNKITDSEKTLAESKNLSNFSSNFCICGSCCSCPCERERIKEEKSSDTSYLLDESTCIADASLCSCSCKHKK